MQREEDGGIVISCDFCGVDWDGQSAMVEGHKGSVLCLECLRRALDEAEAGEAFSCTMCLQDFEAEVKRWRYSGENEGEVVAKRNAEAAICWADIRQAAKAFHKDKDVDFRWDPGKYPV